jgi:hypothetical protein
MASDLEAILERMALELAQIREELASIHGLLGPKRCTQADRGRLERLLPALAGLFGSTAFSTSEALEDLAIRTISGSSQATGALLGRAADDQGVVSGLQVIRAGRDHNKQLWQIGSRLPSAIAAARKPGHTGQREV